MAHYAAGRRVNTSSLGHSVRERNTAEILQASNGIEIVF
jgi:hypothetical protein